VDVIYSRYERGGVSASDVRRFIEGAVNARYSDRYTPGAGRLCEINGGTDGAGLAFDDDAVHVHLFRGYAEAVPPPRPVPYEPIPRPPIVPLPRPYPEERLWRESGAGRE
jgi:hypothetical protein